jgi:hypothetical protein
MFHRSRDLLLRPKAIHGSGALLFVGNRLVVDGQFKGIVGSVSIAPEDPKTVVLHFGVGPGPAQDSAHRITLPNERLAAAELRNYTRALQHPAHPDWHYLESPPRLAAAKLPPTPCLYPEAVMRDNLAAVPSRILLDHGRPLHLLEDSTPSITIAFHLANAILHLLRSKPDARPVGYYIAPLPGQERTVVVYKMRDVFLPCPPPIPLLLYTTGKSAMGGDSSSGSITITPAPYTHIMDQASKYVAEAFALFGSAFHPQPTDAVFESLVGWPSE